MTSDPAEQTRARPAEVRPEDLMVAGLCLLGAAVAAGEGVPRYFGRQGIGPGAFPTWVAVLLACCALLMVGKAVQQRRLAPWERWPRGTALRRVAAAVASLFLYLLVLPLLGFWLASSLLLLFHFRVLGSYRWRAALPMAFGSALVVTFVFGTLLFMPLPDGLLGF